MTPLSRMPNMSDVNRKRTLADWVVKSKKQVVKLYAIVKWSRDAAVVQKSMVRERLKSSPFVCLMASQNITAFLMEQNLQFTEAIQALTTAKDSLDPARLRNHDLLTSLDVLTTGSYRRLPSNIHVCIFSLYGITLNPDLPLSCRRSLSFHGRSSLTMKYKKHYWISRTQYDSD